MATSHFATGPYGEASQPITGDYWAEGPTVIKIHGSWHLYFDKYILKKYGLLVSNDFINWTEKSDQLEYPSGMRHGTAFRVAQNILDALKNL